MASRRLTKARCAELRRDLTDLGYGQAETETSEQFSPRLYPVSEHLRALDPTVVLVVGSRGAGKSELFRAFFEHGAEVRDAVMSHARLAASRIPSLENAKWLPAYPQRIDFPDEMALRKHIQSDDQAQRTWHTMLVRCLKDELDESSRSALEPILSPMAADLGAVLRAVDSLEISPTVALDLLEERLAREGKWIFLGYDELDTLGGNDWVLMARLIRGLMAFWSSYGRRWERLRAKVFLRSDLFRRHATMGTADFAKLAANRAELRWSKAALLGMLVKRIANTSPGLEHYCRGAKIRFDRQDHLGLLPRIDQPDDAFPLLQRMVGEHMGATRKKGYVRNWVFAHLYDGNQHISPRTMVRLFECAATKDAVNQTVAAPRLLHPTALRQGLSDVAGDHVVQGHNEWPWLEGVKRRLARQPLVPWERSVFNDLLSRDWTKKWDASDADVRPPADRPADLGDYLIELGIVRKRTDDRIDVPDLYLFGFGLRRKGGVRVRPATSSAP